MSQLTAFFDNLQTATKDTSDNSINVATTSFVNNYVKDFTATLSNKTLDNTCKLTPTFYPFVQNTFINQCNPIRGNLLTGNNIVMASGVYMFNVVGYSQFQLGGQSSNLYLGFFILE